jgi:hypothetical protein
VIREHVQCERLKREMKREREREREGEEKERDLRKWAEGPL